MSNKVFVDASLLFNKPETRDKFEMFGDDPVPVDLNGGSIPWKKDGADNLINAQASIRHRFDLGR